MTAYTKTVQLASPLLPGDTLTLTVKAPVPVTPPVVITLPPTPPATPPSGSALTSQPTPPGSAPALGQTITEGPVKVTCISTVTRHAYPLTNPWNIGVGPESRIMLNFSPGSTQILLGVPPYTLLKTIQVPTYAFWSTTDAHTIYGANGNQLVNVSDSGGPFHLVHDFGAPVSIGNFEGGVSNDGCIALTAGGNLIVWDVVNGRLVGSIPQPANMDGFQISRSGLYVVVRGGNTRVYPRSLVGGSLELDPYSNHGACSLIGGMDYYVGCNAVIAGKAAGVVAYRLSDGKATVMIPPANAFSYGNVGGYGPRPILSAYDATKVVGQPGRDQIVGANLDGTVVPFGWSHKLSPDLNDGPSYRHQPHAVGDPTGLRVLSSDWDTGGAFIHERAA